MRLTRVYVESPLAAGAPVEIGGRAANHIARVLRLRAGDPLVLFDGRGGEYTARILTLRKDAVQAEVIEHVEIERESPLAITLAQGVSRGDRMDLVVQKATELGVARIVPLLTERTVVRLDDAQCAKKVQHWQAIAVAACEQCGRNRVPEVASPMRFGEFVARSDPGTVRVLLSPEGTIRTNQLARPPGGVTLLIGPEGGLSDAEVSAALDAGFTAVCLGPRILRTETAAFAALTAIQHDFGDM
ncbi:MAG: 16S rRNA (uracil(1498)-N(3))-methyltransferase [Pseudomonadota bacterium]|jgi:RNA methyltransferase, RsmE family|nr:MAG: 16S rRNA (uracil(1498)-N(3))-methyltransferase [Pseudomonadota bacterium]